MAFSYVESTGDGVQRVYSFRFTGDGYGYFRESDVHAYVAGVKTSFKFVTSNSIEFENPPALGAKVLIRRIMPKNKPYTDWSRGNDFSALNVNNSFLQQLYTQQELFDGFMTEGFRFNENLSIGMHKITDLAPGENPNDAVNLAQVQHYEGSAGDSADKAAASAAAAKISEDNAMASEVASGASKQAAAASERAAAESTKSSKVSEVNASASAGTAIRAAVDAQASKAAIESKESWATIHAERARVAANDSEASAVRSKSEADRAQRLADTVDQVAITGRLTSLEAEDVRIKQSVADLGTKVSQNERYVIDQTLGKNETAADSKRLAGKTPADLMSKFTAESTKTANTLVSAHEAKPDPHPQYATDTELSELSDSVQSAISIAQSKVATVNGVGPDASGNVDVNIPSVNYDSPQSSHLAIGAYALVRIGSGQMTAGAIVSGSNLYLAGFTSSSTVTCQHLSSVVNIGSWRSHGYAPGTFSSGNFGGVTLAQRIA